MSVRYWTSVFRVLCPRCGGLLAESATKWGESAFYCPTCNVGWPIDHPALRKVGEDTDAGKTSSGQRHR